MLMRSLKLPSVWRWQPYILLALITLVTYWPLATGTFSLKNDAYIYFLPWRFHISESIQHGYFPFWNPYLYTGLPVSSDIQSGAWNPIVIIISLFTTYSMRILQWELLLYIFIAGIGIFKLTKEFRYTRKTSLVASVCYICCGFMTDSGSFIPWITSAAYLPFLFLYFIRALNTPAFATSVKFALVSFLLFTAGYPSFFIYAGYLLLAGFLYWLITEKKSRFEKCKVIKQLLLSLIFFSLLSLPAIISFVDFFAYYQRGRGATLSQALTDPFNLFCSISYLFTWAVTKKHEWFHTDIAMRNAYVGIFTFAFLAISITLPFTKIKKFIFYATLFSFLFSLGETTPLRAWCYNLLPGMDSFRHPATTRVFTSIGIILLAAESMNIFFTRHPAALKEKLKIATNAFIVIILFFLTYYSIKHSPFNALNTADSDLKTLFNSTDLPILVIILGTVQLVFLFLFLFWLGNKKRSLLLMIFNSILLATTALPFSFISQTKAKDVDAYISSFPPGFPKPNLLDPIFPSSDSSFGTEFNDYSKFFNKKITIQEDLISPTINNSYSLFLSDTVTLKGIRKLPFVFVSSKDGGFDSSAKISIANFSPLAFSFEVTTDNNRYLNLFQQFNHHWTVQVNKRYIIPEKAFIAFMKVKIPKGRSEILFRFKPSLYLVISIFISASLLFVLAVYTFLTERKSFYKKSDSIREKGN